MIQEPLWHDSLEDAIRATVDAVGGPKHVASELWLSRKIDDGARYLHHCLDSDRPEKLSLGEILWIAKEGRGKGVHTVVSYLCSELGYAPPQPLQPEDEQAELQRQFIRAVEALETIQKQQQRIAQRSA